MTAWLSSAKWWLYGAVVSAFAVLTGMHKREKRLRKQAEKEASNAKAKAAMLAKQNTIEAQIDVNLAEKRRDRENAHLKAITDLGEIHENINNLTDIERADAAERVRKQRFDKFKRRKNPR